MWHAAVLGDDDDAVADVIKLVVNVFRFIGRGNDAVAPDAGILVDDGVLDAGVVADANARLAEGLMTLDRLERLVVIAAEHDRTVELAAIVQDAPNADDALSDFRAIDDAPVRNDRMVDRRPVDLGTREKARPGEDRRAHVEKVEPRQFRARVEIGFKE